LLSYLIPSSSWRAVLFMVLAVILMLVGFFSGAGSSQSLQDLKQDVETMTEGNLRILKQRSSDPVLDEFSTSLVLLNSRLRQIVDKVKNVSGSVGSTSQSIVQLSRLLLKSGQSQSFASENASKAMSDINTAIKRIAQGAEELNQLGVTVSSSTLELTANI